MAPAVVIELALAGTFVVLAGLAALTFARKTRRDHREAESRDRRARLRAALLRGGGELDAALRALHGRGADVDLASALALDAEALDPAQLGCLHAAARRTGLAARLERDLRARSPYRRGLAALVLGRLRLPGTVERLEPLLVDRDLEVRLTAAAAIGMAETPAAAHVLVDALAQGHVSAERIVERIAEPWAVQALLGTLASLEAFAGNTTAIVGIARALGLAGDLSAEPALLRLLAGADLEARISAARALGELGCAAALPELEAALADDAWPLRAQAARALGETLDPHAVPALYRALGDPAWWVRANAATALRRLGEPGLAALRRALMHDDAYARDRAREALALERVAVTVTRPAALAQAA